MEGRRSEGVKDQECKEEEGRRDRLVVGEGGKKRQQNCKLASLFFKVDDFCWFHKQSRALGSLHLRQVVSDHHVHRQVLTVVQLINQLVDSLGSSTGAVEHLQVVQVDKGGPC